MNEMHGYLQALSSIPAPGTADNGAFGGSPTVAPPVNLGPQVSGRMGQLLPQGMQGNGLQPGQSGGSGGNGTGTLMSLIAAM